MKSFACVLLPCLLMFSSMAVDADNTSPAIEMKHIDETPRQQTLREVTDKLMKKPLPAMDWPEASLAEVFSDLEKASGIQFEIHWTAMELVGIDQDSLVRHKSKNRTLKEVLPAVLDQVSADAFDDDKLGYASRDGVLVISTRRVTKDITVSRTYNIGPLLREPYRPVGLYFSDEAFEDAVAYHAWLRGERHAPLTDAMLLKIYKYHHEKKAKELAALDPDNLVPAEEPKQPEGGLFGDGVLERPGPNEFVQPVINDLVELIQETAGDWDDWIDEDYKISVSSDLLIIKASVPTHDQIEKLLNQLLEAEIDKQTAMLKDAHASKQVAQANQCLKDGDKAGAMEHVNQALWIMPDHVPANAMKRVLESMGEKPAPVN
jgi:uncharacterized Fe-S cluster protein YjdI